MPQPRVFHFCYLVILDVYYFFIMQIKMIEPNDVVLSVSHSSIKEGDVHDVVV